MKIAIVGSRGFKDKEFIENMIPEILRTSKYILISGGAEGVDSWAENMATWLGCKSIIFKPDWNKYGKRAGAIRNQQIVDEADKVIAFWDGTSKGTKITIDMAIKANKPLDIYVR